MATLAGSPIAATGTITSNTASLLSFASTVKYTIINNNSGKRAYFKINDAASPTVSSTAYHFSIADGAPPFTINDGLVDNISVYVEATSGIVAVGWQTSIG